MKIEIWSDLICPWCYIGKRRFETALARAKKTHDVQIVWRSFELDPTTPTNLTESLEQLLAGKYHISPAQAAEMNARVSNIAALEGLNYDLAHARPGNTFAAHRLIHFATTLGLGEALMERLMRGYFGESLPIGEHDALLQVATEVGLDTSSVQSVLLSDQYAAEVRADEKRAMSLGIRGVPFFLFNEKEGISGAQPLDVFAKVFSTTGD